MLFPFLLPSPPLFFSLLLSPSISCPLLPSFPSPPLPSPSAYPVVSLLASNSPASVGDNITITCTASEGIPPDYSFEWFNGSTFQQPLPSFVSDGSMDVLSLLSIQRSDFVTYTCRVNNSVTSVTKSIDLMEAGTYICITSECCIEIRGAFLGTVLLS